MSIRWIARCCALSSVFIASALLLECIGWLALTFIVKREPYKTRWEDLQAVVGLLLRHLFDE